MIPLNEAQKKAVETTEGPVLIVAGAGTGKTRVITERIINLIIKGIAPSSILAITFTNKAANEMKSRVDHSIINEKRLNLPAFEKRERPFVSTFHSLGVHIIRENSKELGLNRHFTIYDRSDSRRAIKEAMIERSVDPKQFDPAIILNLISRAKGDGISYLEYRDRAKGYMEEITSEIWEKYDAILQKEKALDFDDLLLRAQKLLAESPKILQHYSNLWKYIHVDEYQDTNRVQYKTVRLLAHENKNLCVVGDADQNIYSWRGATIENILNFEKDYPDAAVITLEKNYRSTKIILDAANSVIKKNRQRKDKNLYTDNEEGEKISLSVSYTEEDEARNIADTARDLIEKGSSPKEIAVLYRANFQSRILEEVFIKKNIPYQLLGTKFFDRKEIKDLISYIRASLNRESYGDIARIINFPTRGIGKASLAKILSGQEGLLPPNMKEKVATFWALLDEIALFAKNSKPSELISLIIKRSGIEESLMNKGQEEEERLLNLRELISVGMQYDELGPEAGLEAFLTNCALYSDQDELQKDKDAVKLMTVHAAKGLEFDYVFIAGMEQDLFPYKHMGEKDINNKEDEEERRLFYVALTRAKKKVFLSYAIMRTIFGAQKVNTPSEFINDIDKDIISDSQPEKPSGAKALFIDF